MLELHASIAGLLATYDDGGSQLADAADTHLGLHLGPVSADAELSPGALYLQVSSFIMVLRAVARYTLQGTWCTVGCQQCLDLALGLTTPVRRILTRTQHATADAKAGQWHAALTQSEAG